MESIFHLRNKCLSQGRPAGSRDRQPGALQNEWMFHLRSYPYLRGATGPTGNMSRFTQIPTLESETKTGCLGWLHSGKPIHLKFETDIARNLSGEVTASFPCPCVARVSGESLGDILRDDLRVVCTYVQARRGKWPDMCLSYDRLQSSMCTKCLDVSR